MSGTLAFQGLAIVLEMMDERSRLRELGLSDEEIDGYFEFYMDNYVEEFKPTVTTN